MRFTTLKIAHEGVLFFNGHRARLGPEGDEVLAAFDQFAMETPPGVYRLWAADRRLRYKRRAQTQMRDGMPTRLARSPFATESAPFFKPPPGGPYDPLRLPGQATLLTTESGVELLEEASSAIVFVQNNQLTAVPQDRPRVLSVCEATLDAALGFERAPLLADSSAPIALLNAVVGVCLPEVAGRAPFPPLLLAKLRAVVEASYRCAV